MAQNSKIVAFIDTLGQGGRALLQARTDITMLPFSPLISTSDYHALLRSNPQVHALILGVQPVGAPELAVAPHLQVVARVGVGFDMIDVPSLTPRRIPLMTAGTSNSPSVAEQTFHLLFALIKRGREQDRLVREGRWTGRMAEMPSDIFGKTMLVIGFGRIGSRVVRRALAMDMVVHVFDPYVSAAAIEAAGAVAVAQLDDALPHADVVTIHCPRTPNSMGLIDARRLLLLRPTAILINTARGGLVDEAALLGALRAGKLAGAGLDVLMQEPPPADHPLFGEPNVILAPHMAGVTRESVERMSVVAVQNVLSVFDTPILAANVVNPMVLESGKNH